jgi:hypothetical protein
LWVQTPFDFEEFDQSMFVCVLLTQPS